MKFDLQPALDLIKTLVQPSQGTKFLVAILSIYVVYEMAVASLGSTPMIVVGCVAVAYGTADCIYKTFKLKIGECTCEETDSDAAATGDPS